MISRNETDIHKISLSRLMAALSEIRMKAPMAVGTAITVMARMTDIISDSKFTFSSNSPDDEEDGWVEFFLKE